MNYLWGALLTIGAELSISFANVFDGQLSRRTFSSIWSIVSLNSLLTIPALPFFYLILKPNVLSKNQLILIGIVASFEFLYQIPYYKALRTAETSIVVMLFNIEKIFIPLLAFFILKEKLTYYQYIGFAIIIICSFIGTFEKKRFTLNSSFFYMVLACLILAGDEILQKYSLDKIEWKTFYFWQVAFSIPFGFVILFSSRQAKLEVLNFLRSPLKKKFIPLYSENIIAWLSGGLAVLSLSLIPITIKKAFETIPSIFVHIIASKSPEQYNLAGKEQLSIRRLVLLIIAALGTILTFITK